MTLKHISILNVKFFMVSNFNVRLSSNKNMVDIFSLPKKLPQNSTDSWTKKAWQLQKTSNIQN